MGKYFNDDIAFGRHSFKTLRIEDSGGGDEPEGNGWYIMKGGMVSPKGKLLQADPIALCATKKEAEILLEKLCSIE